MSSDQLIATRHVDAPLSRVWEAFTTPSDLAAFWGGRHAVVPPGSVSVDLRVGGGFELETGPGHPLRFRYDLVEPPTLLRFTEPLTGIVTTVRLEAVPGGRGDDPGTTTVTVHQHRVPPELRTEQAARGLAGILDQLATTLTRSTP